jgi:hypothetical protein
MKPLTLTLALLVAGCASQPLQQLPPSAWEPITEQTRCIERCRIQHDACMQDPRQLCSIPCSQGLFHCRLGCAPMTAGPPLMSPWGDAPPRSKSNGPFNPWKSS